MSAKVEPLCIYLPIIEVRDRLDFHFPTIIALIGTFLLNCRTKLNTALVLGGMKTNTSTPATFMTIKIQHFTVSQDIEPCGYTNEMNNSSSAQWSLISSIKCT